MVFSEVSGVGVVASGVVSGVESDGEVGVVEGVLDPAGVLLSPPLLSSDVHEARTEIHITIARIITSSFFIRVSPFCLVMMYYTIFYTICQVNNNKREP